MLPDASADDAWHTPVADAGVDSGCRNVIVSPTVQFGKATLYEPPGVGEAGVTVALVEPPATVVVVAPATVVVVAPATVVVVVVLPATVVVVVVVESATVVVVVEDDGGVVATNAIWTPEDPPVASSSVTSTVEAQNVSVTPSLTHAIPMK